MRQNGDDDDDWTKLSYSIPVNWIVKDGGSRKHLVYNPPKWASSNKVNYGLSLDVIMNGQLLSNISLDNKSYYIIGSLQNSDVYYPSAQVSRSHVVLQYHRDKRLLVMDLDSKYGTILNGKKLETLSYYPYNVGDQLILGTPDINRRIFVLNGPSQLIIPPIKLHKLEQKTQNKGGFKSGNKKSKEKLDAEVNSVCDVCYDMFDEDEEFFDRTNTSGNMSDKKRKVRHSAESLKYDIARLGEQEINVFNRWYKLLRTQYNPNGGVCDETALDFKIELEQDKIMLQQELDAYRLEMSRFIKLLEIATL
ncbi:Kanadaptin [Babesia microti strain RI]|uniref:Kanadaptin n=1 Tax=Babesia microti (strain RI) TaxID=1133968 RepID=A0A1N6LWJ7_BABMR|nr:Kanadaptin [Babesia microti strain RI]SIO73243.1 Kanadaptin [Babesia microti strain RI]|eukprot:XP_021337350.1 Kanadaptin [Babesia microti strain RI]